MSSSEADSDVMGWFSARGLPWTANIANTLNEFGIACVEDLKLVPHERFLDLFSIPGKPAKLVIAAKTKIAHESLCKERFDFRQCAKDHPLHIQDDVSDITSSSEGSSKRKKLSNHALQ